MEITEEEESITENQNSPRWEHQEYPVSMGKGKQRKPAEVDSIAADTTPQKPGQASLDDSPNARSRVRQFVQQRTVVCENCDTRFMRANGIDSSQMICESCRKGRRPNLVGEASSTRSQGGPVTTGKHKVKNPASPSMKAGITHRLAGGVAEKVVRPTEPRRKVKEQIQWTLIDPRSR
jgi:hypothetical protein